ncbi:hypothetical protein KFL01_24130 [Kocuria flava]|uniref:HTH cro/C1-type domain-containing protein n=2 Tax=Kocuria flava TaxID=446860 RepID=A0ABQ0X647_9MICC|nr:hypothetical protein KFL01_24130 [Kocuria flava]
MGSTAANVATNLRALRGSMPLRTLSAQLDALGHPMSASALQRIESGERRVDVDDLSALAVVLGVHPNRLLLPPDEREGRLTGTEEAPLEVLGAWLNGLEPLPEQRQVLLERAASMGEAPLSLVRSQADPGRTKTPEEVDDYVARLVFRDEVGSWGPLSTFHDVLRQADGPVYVCDATGETVMKEPLEAPEPFWAPDVDADEDPNLWRGHVVREIKRLMESVQHLQGVVERGGIDGLN